MRRAVEIAATCRQKGFSAVSYPEMVEHKHLPPDERRIPWGRVRLGEVVDELYELLGEIESGSDSP